MYCFALSFCLIFLVGLGLLHDFQILYTDVQFFLAWTSWRSENSGLLKTLVTIRLSGTVMEIWRLKENVVTTLTFWGHVTSSVTWPFDSRGSTFYGWSIVAMLLSSNVMEIWPFELFPGRLFQEQRSVVGRSVGRSSILHWSYIGYSSSLR